MSESEPSAMSESELIARDTNPFMEAWKRAANSCVAPAMDEDALPTSEDEQEEELGAIQPVNPLEYKQRTAGWRCRWFHGKKSRCFEPRECRKWLQARSGPASFLRKGSEWFVLFVCLKRRNPTTKQREQEKNPTSKQSKPRGCMTPRCRQSRTRG